MSDLHRLPLLGHDLPLAADLRRQVRAKARVYRYRDCWTWKHDCGSVTTTGFAGYGNWELALYLALQHVGRCR